MFLNNVLPYVSINERRDNWRSDFRKRFIELVKDSATQEHFSEKECDQLLGEILSPRTFELGLICRTEDKAEPVIQIAPPLIAGPDEFREIVRILRQDTG